MKALKLLPFLTVAGYLIYVSLGMYKSSQELNALEAQKQAEAQAKLDLVGDKSEAIYYAEEFVRDLLKSPKSAEFSEEAASLAGEVWSVRGSVDAQNSFGAMLRSNFLCTVKKVGKEKWRLTTPCEVVGR